MKSFIDKKILLVLLMITALAGNLFSQQEEEKEKKFTMGGYGVILYQNFDYGANRKATAQGSASESRAIIDIQRFVLEMDYNFTPTIKLGTEIEFEHGGTGSSMELEYEEFGEYEAEVEKGGEVALEQFHITKTFSKALNLRAGHFIVEVGQLNHRHRPQSYFTTIRSEGEDEILPVTWHETGVEVFGELYNFAYHVQVVNGLDASGFSSEHWIKEGYQTSFELTRATDLAYAARLDYSGVKGLTVGVSGYYGNTTGNSNKAQVLNGIDGHLTILSAQGTYNGNGIIARGNYLYGNLENADLISKKNASLSSNTQFARTPVAKGAMAWAVEAGYDVFRFISDMNSKLYPFARYEYYNSMEEVSGTVYADKRFKRNVFSFGLNYLPIREMIIKMDYSMRELGDGAYNDENTFGLSIAFSGTFFSI